MTPLDPDGLIDGKESRGLLCDVCGEVIEQGKEIIVGDLMLCREHATCAVIKPHCWVCGDEIKPGTETIAHVENAEPPGFVWLCPKHADENL